MGAPLRSLLVLLHNRAMEPNSFYETAVAEEKELLGELKRLEAEHQARRAPLLRKLEATQQVKAAYSPDEPGQPSPRRRVALIDDDAPAAANLPRLKEASSHKARVAEGAMQLLASGAPMKTPLLLEQLEARGIDFQAKDKLTNLSAILSRDDRFVSDRRIGWSLAQKNPQDAATSAGSLPT
jgi:hypothetical protein